MWKKITTIVVLVVAILTTAFIYQSIEKDKTVDLEEEKISEETYADNSLVIKHQYKNRKHVFVGEIETPTPCYELETEILDTENSTLKRINIETSKLDGQCAQVLANKNFKIEYEGEENLDFESYINGQKYRLNIFEVEPGVNIDTFEIFIKG